MLSQCYAITQDIPSSPHYTKYKISKLVSWMWMYLESSKQDRCSIQQCRNWWLPKEDVSSWYVSKPQGVNKKLATKKITLTIIFPTQPSQQAQNQTLDARKNCKTLIKKMYIMSKLPGKGWHNSMLNICTNMRTNFGRRPCIAKWALQAFLS
jgi:hypothetical protein